MTALTSSLPTDTIRQSGKRPVDHQALSTRLLGSAATKSYDRVVDIDWSAPIPDRLYGLSPEWSTLDATPLWDGVTEDQRVTLTIPQAAARANTHHGDKLRDATTGLVAFLRDVGLVGGASELLWKRARLVRRRSDFPRRKSASPGRAGSRRGRSPRRRPG